MISGVKYYSPANIGSESLTSDKSNCDIWLASTMGCTTFQSPVDYFLKLHGNGMTCRKGDFKFALL